MAERVVAMTEKQIEMVSKAKAILKILNPLEARDRAAVAALVYQLLEAEDRQKQMEAAHDLAQEKAAYANGVAGSTSPLQGGLTPIPGGLFRA